MRKTSLNTVYELAKTDERVVFIGSDLGAGTLDAFRREMPKRFFMEGVNEANIIGMAAGLASEGHIVYVNTLAVFLTRRALEQVAVDVCLHNLNVRLIGNGGGLVYGPLGPTHMATDDIALMRALPNMRIIAPADAREMERAMRLVHDAEGPAYIRLGRGGDPIVAPEGSPGAIGKATPVREGGDVLIVTTGITLRIAVAAAEILARDGRQAAILHFPTIKPLDEVRLKEAVERVPVVVTVEEHIESGGLGSAVAEVIAETPWPEQKRFRRLALPDVFPDKYGRQEELLDQYGLTADNLASLVRTLSGES